MSLWIVVKYIPMSIKPLRFFLLFLFIIKLLFSRVSMYMCCNVEVRNVNKKRVPFFILQKTSYNLTLCFSKKYSFIF